MSNLSSPASSDGRKGREFRRTRGMYARRGLLMQACLLFQLYEKRLALVLTALLTAAIWVLPAQGVPLAG